MYYPDNERPNALIIFALLAILAFAAMQYFSGLAAAAEVTCADGRKVEDTRSGPLGPFQPNPCLAPAEAPKISDEFLLVFGPPPKRSEFPSDLTGYYHWRSSLVHWRQNLKYFGGIVEAPDGVDPAVVAEAAAFYIAWGMPAPIYYTGRYSQGARFLPAVGRPHEASARVAAVYPGIIVANYQIRQIRSGFCIGKLYPTVPPSIQALNRKACE